MNESDRVRLRHMLDASREVQDFVKGASRESLDTDLKLVRALSMSIGIIGEAANNVSQEVCEANPQIPWRSAIAMRHFLFHAYYKVDLNVLWVTATDNVPALMAELERLPSDNQDK
ncbi:MAG: DUF86 domain-containing protein [Anaerolineae bacterium]|nr:DUF86 domain-containing protein [Anaerolineae bacterium]